MKILFVAGSLAFEPEAKPVTSIIAPSYGLYTNPGLPGTGLAVGNCAAAGADVVTCGVALSRGGADVSASICCVDGGGVAEITARSRGRGAGGKLCTGTPS